MRDYTSELNTEQWNVVEHGDGPCLVLAGAGSGKTRTITYRVAYLLEHGIDPDNILLVTFTNKAAHEMKERVELLLKETGQNIQLPWAGTFHHIAYRLLKQYASLLGYQNNFTILDSEDSRDMIKMCLKQEGVDRSQKRFPSANVLQSLMSYARNSMKTIEEVLDEKNPNWLPISEVIVRIADEYRKKKLESNAMDFDDLLVNLYLLLAQSESVRTKLTHQFQYILVDEYQDTNRVQAGIVNLLAQKYKNLLVVGDDAQSIYSFRAADIQNILAFEKQYPNAKIFRLETNYRSTPNILDVANVVIENNKAQYEKKLKSIQENFAKPEVHAFADQRDEAEFIAGRILELRDEGIDMKNIAVLFRASHHSQSLEVELTKRNIPYDYRGGTRFFERSHIKDVLAFLKIIHNKNDIIAWSRVLNMQVGIGPAVAQKIIQLAGEAETLEDFRAILEVLPQRAKIGFQDFLSIWDDLQKKEKLEATKDPEPADLIYAVLDSKYADYLENEYDNYRERIQDIEQLAMFSEKEKNLGKFLAEASMQESYQNTAGKENFAEEKIVLSTIHQAKGLEWSAVFVINLSSGEFPNMRALKESNGVEEERRLFYVAVTRAKKFLHLTYPLVSGFNSMFGGPSMFIEEIDKDLIDEYGVMGESTNSWKFSDPSDDGDGVEYIPEGEEFSQERRKKSFLKSIDEL
ncbi:MAG: UvrD-helicase domain-containing protein [Candidatus Magasanikbacteria bacterium]